MTKREIIERASYLITCAWSEVGDLDNDTMKMGRGVINLYYSLAFQKLLEVSISNEPTRTIKVKAREVVCGLRNTYKLAELEEKEL